MENKKEQVMRETKLLVDLFLKYNESDIELSKRTGISSSTIGRRLTNRDIILMCFPSNGKRIYDIIQEKRKYNSLRGKSLGNQTSVLNNFSGTPKLRLDVVYKDEIKQMKFLSQLVLTYRAKIPLICELFGFEEKDILDKLLAHNKNCHESFEYLFFKDNYDQELAKNNIIQYYKELVEAIAKKDIATQNVLIREIGDSEIVDFFTKHKMGEVKTKEEIEMLLKYQLKYALSSKKMSEKFRFNRTTYVSRVRELVKDDIELSDRFEELNSNIIERTSSPWTR